ncbi:MAG: iron donor protein CyaY [Betaproteobacteria bacterium]|nr:iron donor protein CyaY [Betaproteobacteria bacterium]
MTESEFHRCADALMAAVDEAIHDSAAAERAGIECDCNGGILTLECADGSKVIVNRQTPMREIWVAAKGGGFHFRLIDGQWRDTRNGTSFADVLNAALAAQSGHVIGITI